jgi:hypothetical protein
MLEEAPDDRLHDADITGERDPKRLVHRQVGADLSFQEEAAGGDVSHGGVKRGFPARELDPDCRHRPVTVHAHMTAPVYGSRRRGRRGRVASQTISPPYSSANSANPSVTRRMRSNPIRFCGKRTNTDQPACGCNMLVRETFTCAAS